MKRFSMSLISFLVVLFLANVTLSEDYPKDKDEIASLIKKYIHDQVFSMGSIGITKTLGIRAGFGKKDLKYESFEILKFGEYQEERGIRYLPVRTQYKGTIGVYSSFIKTAKLQYLPFHAITDFALKKNGFGEWEVLGVIDFKPVKSEEPTRSASPAQSTEPPEIKDITKSNVALNGIGPIRVGMTVDEAYKSIGTEFVVTQGDTQQDCYYIRPNNAPEGIEFMVIDNLIVRVDITNNTYKTKSGGTVGSTEDEIKRMYPGYIQVEGHKYDPDGHYLIYVPRDQKDQQYRLIFETDGHRVTNFRVGKLPEVGYVEGCL